MAEITDRGIKALTEPGRYGVGGGLWLQVRKPDSNKKRPARTPARSWLFRYTWKHKQRVMGLGPYPDVGLAEARDAAYEARKMLRAGTDPMGVKRAKVAKAAAIEAAMTFDAVAKLYIEAHEETWRNPKHRQQWRNTLQSYVTPVFGNVAVQEVETGQVMKVLAPLWKEKVETASRLRGRIEAVLDYAKSSGWRTGENPARWNGHVENLLPKRAKVAVTEHHAAMPWADIGGFMAALADQPGTGALALRFTILTAARTGEVIGARWGEIDLANATWSIPGERMKAGLPHRVPLTDAALDVLRTLLPLRPDAGDGYVFPGRGQDKGLSNMSLAAVLKRMGLGDVTVHGFRSTFRQWVGERTTVAREVAEAALAHSLKDKTEAAYARGDLFDRRRNLMESWAAFCGTVEAPSEGVVPIRKAG